MGLEESPHCPFDVMEACRTGVDKEWLKMEGQQEICGGGGGGDGGAAEEMDRDEADDGGGEPCSAEMTREMDQDGSGVGGLSGRVYPAGWTTKTRRQKHRYKQRRRK